LNFLEGAAIGAVVASVIGYPLVAPWPTRLRWLIASQVPDPLSGLAPFPRLVLREVVVVDVRVLDDEVELTIADGPARRSLSTRPRAPDAVLRCKRWYATAMPLLMMVDDHGTTELSGPDGSVGGLRSVHAPV
jgi:hypothetical protein